MKKIINPFIHLEGYNCFGCAPHNPLGVHMEFYEDGDDIVSYWKPRSDFQGWLNTLHGGVQSVLLDEICAWALMRKLQTAGVTSRMETRFMHPISTNDPQLTLRAHITAQRRNLVTIEATIADSTGKVCTQATCLYFAFPPEKSRTQMHFDGCRTEDETANSTPEE